MTSGESLKVDLKHLTFEAEGPPWWVLSAFCVFGMICIMLANPSGVALDVVLLFLLAIAALLFPLCNMALKKLLSRLGQPGTAQPQR